jgi:hypothetical protein
MRRISKKPKTKYAYYKYHLLMWRTMYDFLCGLSQSEFEKVSSPWNYNLDYKFLQFKEIVFKSLFTFKSEGPAHCFLCDMCDILPDDVACLLVVNCNCGHKECLGGLYKKVYTSFNKRDLKNTIKYMKEIINLPVVEEV